MQKITEYRTPEGFFDADIDITKEEWLSIIDDPAIKDNSYLDVLIKFLREPDHKSTCKALGKKYDCSYNYFNAGVMNFGKHVKNKLNRFYVENTNGTESFWNIPMIGQYVKNGFEWTLRKELVDALQEYLVNDLIARYKAFVMSPASEFSGEKYKWELLTETKDMDTKGILAAITKSGMNIVDMPRAGMAIKALLKDNPEAIESAFNELLNTERSFSENYSSYLSTIKPAVEGKFGFGFPDERTAAAFLTCARPATYTFYMDKIYQEYCHYLGEAPMAPGNKYMHYLKLVSRLSQLANNIKELRYHLMEETKGLFWSDLLVGQDVLWEMQQNMAVNNNSLGYAWTAFYEEFADKISPYSQNQGDLLDKLKTVFSDAGQTMAKLSFDGETKAVDPFTIYGMFNKRESHEKRSELAAQLKVHFGMESEVPLRFDGIPVLNPLSAAFYSFESDEKEAHINNIWGLFKTAIDYSSGINTQTRDAFVAAYNIVRLQPRIKWNLTMGLFWMRPNSFLSLDTNNRNLLLSGKALSETATAEIASILGKKGQIPAGDGYLRICDIVREEIHAGKCPYPSFLDFSRAAWEIGNATDENETEEEQKTETDNMNYWLIVANPEMWSVSTKPVGTEEFYTFYNEKGNPRKLFKNFQAAAAGDPVIFYEATPTKQAVSLGEIVSQDGSELHFRKTADFENPVDFAVLDSTPELASMEFLANKNGSLFRLSVEEYNKIIELSKLVEEENEYEPYTKRDFLSDVFMDESLYDRIVSILRIKKNLILKGAPGVGKTYAAKRLAYSIMGEKDTNRVKFVQFHQSYSYEDFVMGYRPNDSGGFVLRNGVFYEFCKLAEKDTGHDYYFIIDEINRGNLSKIFGELFVLMEADKRGEDVQLAYRKESFSVPANLYIIGMLNTADRSLAMIDYALRRRFSFVEMKPALDKLIAKKHIEPSSKLGKLLEEVTKLNEAITEDPSLGTGFCIGHSYFCLDEAVIEANLPNIVEYEIIPMLEEYWFDNPNKATEWSEKLRSAIK